MLDSGIAGLEIIMLTLLLRRRMMKRTIALSLATAVMSLPVWGCGEAEEIVDCPEVCQAKQDCVDSAYDVDRRTDERESSSRRSRVALIDSPCRA